MNKRIIMVIIILIFIIIASLVVKSRHVTDDIQLGDYVVLFSKLNMDTEKEEGSCLVVYDQKFNHRLYELELKGNYTNISALVQDEPQEGVGTYPDYVLSTDDEREQALAKYDEEKQEFVVDYQRDGEYELSPELKLAVGDEGVSLYTPDTYQLVKDPSFKQDDYYYWVADYIQLSNY